MLSSTLIILSGALSMANDHPSGLFRRAVMAFPAGTPFDILLNSANVNLKDMSSVESVSPTGVDVMDIDLFDTDATTISDLKRQGKTVVCYFSAGTREDWRSDANDWQPADYGEAMEDWPGENWANVQSSNVLDIMKKRIAMAVQKGCDGLDPDNVDGYSGNQDGFNRPQSDYSDYVKSLAAEASASGLAIGLKNAIELIPDVLDVVQFAVNEQCQDYDECDAYKPLTQANKAVFQIEYKPDSCSAPTGVDLSIVNKPADKALDTLGGQCPLSGQQVNPTSSTPATFPSPTMDAVSSSTTADVPSSTSQAPTLSTAVSYNSTTLTTIGTGSTPTSSSSALPTPTPANDNDDDNDDDNENDNGKDHSGEGRKHRGHRHGHHGGNNQ